MKLWFTFQRVLQIVVPKPITLHLGEESEVLDKTWFFSSELIRGLAEPLLRPDFFHEVLSQCTRGIEGESRLRPCHFESHFQRTRGYQNGERRWLWECRARGYVPGECICLHLIGTPVRQPLDGPNPSPFGMSPSMFV